MKAFLDGDSVMAINVADSNGHFLFMQYDAALNVPVLGAASGWNRGASAIMSWNGDVGAKQFFYGLMDNFKLYNYALSNADIAAAYKNNIAPFAVTEIANGPASLVLGARVSRGLIENIANVEIKTGEGVFSNANYAATLLKDGGNKNWNIFVNNLESNTEYVFKVTLKHDEYLNNISNEVTIKTAEPKMLVHLDFENQADGFVTDAVTGKKANINGASIVPSNAFTLGNSIKFIKPFAGSQYVALDSIYWAGVYTSFNEAKAAAYPTELTASTWFKTDKTDGGATILDVGRQSDFILILNKDTLWLGAAYSGDFPIKFALKKGIPFTDTINWHHAAVTFDNGLVNAYLDGNPVMDINLADSNGHFLFLQYDAGLNVPVLGAASGWNRGASAVMSWNGDVGVKQFFYGLMDDFKLYNYALSEADVASMYNNAQSPLTLSQEAGGTESVSLRLAATSGYTEQVKKVEVKKEGGTYTAAQFMDFRRSNENIDILITGL
ncbi:MAG: LamG domain-containing protein, partial [Bacteroidales bacterium]|nr:LamG domain-containing protein [Bacteroidales bacterium]